MVTVVSMASAMFFGVSIFCTVAMAVKSIAGGRGGLLSFPASSRASALDLQSFSSLFALLYNISVLGCVMLYVHLCENHPPYPHSEKSHDQDRFFFFMTLFFVISLFTLRKNGLSNSSDNKIQSTSHFPSRLPASEILNRDQTDEWKGWMQCTFLLYQYQKAEEMESAIRVLMTCYVWMTGFGNASFFYLTGDYSAIRVMRMLWRLNFLVVFLCLTQGTTYILYYICMLHTYYFLVVYATMRISKHLNYSKWGLRIKLFVLAVIIFLTWDVNTGIFQFIHWPFLSSTYPTLGATSGNMWEWYFRSSLDHWSTFLGMLFAMNFPITSHFFRLLEAQPLFHQTAVKCVLGAVLLSLLFVWVLVPSQLGNFHDDQTNAYFGIVPVLAYIYFRNITPWLRSHTLDLLHQVGKMTLETHLLQHHIWLSSNAKTVLTLIPGWPMMNFLLVTIIYFYLSRRLHHVTLYLRGMVLPDNRGACIRNLVGLFSVFGMCMAIAAFLRLVGFLDFSAIAFCSVFLGWILYQIIAAQTWDDLVETTMSSKSHLLSAQLAIAPVTGAMVIVAIGIMWNHVAKTGAGPIRRLPATCADFVQMGKWTSVVDCGNDIFRGVSYRKHKIASFAGCANYIWGWDVSPSSEYCRFSYRDSDCLHEALRYRNVTFIGDSILRHLYHASCRQLGDQTAGAYNTSMEKWSDFSRQYGDFIHMEFRWAPFIGNLTSVLDRIDVAMPPDLVIIGGGAWDRLHTYNTVDEQTLFDRVLALLTQKLHHLKGRIPVVWVVPTTINSWALTSDQKKSNIREDQMAEFRGLYRRKGVNDAVSFVLDGTVFTAGRVEESYDGVHYPLYIYDAGAQILANALDWLLPESSGDASFVSRPVGSMGSPLLGLAMVVLVLVGICCFDGFMGLLCIASCFLPKAAPYHLYEEAYSAFHLRTGLPGISQSSVSAGVEMAFRQQNGHQHESDREDESEQLLNNALAS
jgi:N-acetylneuraminate 9-O-acetyltransferase